MEKDRDPNSAKNTLLLNAFPVQFGFREKEKKNDLVAVNINISILCIPALKTKIITHLSIRHRKGPQSLFCGHCAEIAVPLDVFPVRSRCGEMEMINDLEACEHQRFPFLSGTKNKNKHAPHHPLWRRTAIQIPRISPFP